MSEYIRITELAGGSDERGERANAIAAAIRSGRDFRWVGLYDVADGEVGIIGWAGGGPPTYPRFPADRGLTSRAIAKQASVLVNDVAADEAYLEAFGDTRAELIVPIVRDGAVVGTIDVESERVNGFEPVDVEYVEGCAAAAALLWQTA